ncbi:MAG: hypothetical protein JWQ73_1462 [Variovorax sp.]|nr:hypothetical protein [Variovorax sp.]
MPSHAEPDSPTIALSPDGTLRIEYDFAEDERFGPWGTTRVIALPHGDRLVEVTGRGHAPEAAQFPAAGIVVLPLADRAGTWRTVRIDAIARSFRLLPANVDEPLACLPERLGLTDPAPRYSPPPQVASAARRLVMVIMTLGCLVFVLGGIWLMAAGPNWKDRGNGLLGVLFFGGCLIVSLLEYRKGR